MSRIIKAWKDERNTIHITVDLDTALAQLVLPIEQAVLLYLHLEKLTADDPRDTFRDIQPILEEIGVTRIANITGMDRIGIPVYASIRPDSKSLAVDSGKGTTAGRS